jgi:UDP-glucose 4-epimerase/GDP-4-dehydro-6-deoxy-D-mannose reductase
MNQRVAVTGSTGTIGRNILGFRKIHSRLDHQFQEIQKELTGIPSVDTLLHLSSPTNLLEIESDPAFNRRLILNGTLNLLEAFHMVNGARFIYASSAHVYLPSDRKISEDSKLEPTSVYGEIKRECEIMLEEKCEEFGIQLVIARIFSIYGPDMPFHFLSSKVSRGKESRKYEEVENSSDVRDFSTPKEVAAKLEKVTASNFEGVINICSGLGLRISEKVLQECPSWPTEKLLPGNSKVPILVGDESKFRALFG